MSVQPQPQRTGRSPAPLLAKLREAVDRESFTHAQALAEQLQTWLEAVNDRAVIEQASRELDRLRRRLEDGQQVRGQQLRSLKDQGTAARSYRSCQDIAP